MLWKEQALSRSQKELIALVVAAAYGSTYCFTQHHQTLRSLGLPDHQLDQSVRDRHEAGLSRPDTVLLDFALKLAISAPWLSREDVTVLRDHGFANESILEAILVTGLTNFFCTLSTGLGASPDFDPRAIPGSHKAIPPDKRLYVGGTAGPYLDAVDLSPESFPPFAFSWKDLASFRKSSVPKRSDRM
jgi:uncharacterized peroxidase-related enzyme